MSLWKSKFSELSQHPWEFWIWPRHFRRSCQTSPLPPLPPCHSSLSSSALISQTIYFQSFQLQWVTEFSLKFLIKYICIYIVLFLKESHVLVVSFIADMVIMHIYRGFQQMNTICNAQIWVIGINVTAEVFSVRTFKIIWDFNMNIYFPNWITLFTSQTQMCWGHRTLDLAFSASTVGGPRLLLKLPDFASSSFPHRSISPPVLLSDNAFNLWMLDEDSVSGSKIKDLLPMYGLIFLLHSEPRKNKEFSEMGDIIYII